MKFTAVVALIASVSAGAIEQATAGHPLGDYVERDVTVPTQAGPGGTNTWGCCSFTYDGPGIATGACGKSKTYSTNLCKIDCSTNTTRDLCNSAQDTDRM